MYRNLRGTLENFPHGFQLECFEYLLSSDNFSKWHVLLLVLVETYTVKSESTFLLHSFNDIVTEEHFQ